MRERYKLQITTHDEYWENNKLKASAIEFCKLDSMWMFKKDGWHIDLEDLHELGIPAFDDSAIDLQDKKIYRFPKITLPRQKVDLLKEKHNVKVIRDIEKSDIQYPVLILMNDDNTIKYILDGNHRIQKSIKYNLPTIKAKLIKFSNLPKDVQNILG